MGSGDGVLSVVAVEALGIVGIAGIVGMNILGLFGVETGLATGALDIIGTLDSGGLSCLGVVMIWLSSVGVFSSALAFTSSLTSSSVTFMKCCS